MGDEADRYSASIDRSPNPERSNWSKILIVFFFVLGSMYSTNRVWTRPNTENTYANFCFSLAEQQNRPTHCLYLSFGKKVVLKIKLSFGKKVVLKIKEVYVCSKVPVLALAPTRDCCGGCRAANANAKTR